MAEPKGNQLVLQLTKNDIHNINMFLSRVDLKGREALLFSQLLEKINNQALNQPEEVIEEEVEVDE